MSIIGSALGIAFGGGSGGRSSEKSTGKTSTGGSSIGSVGGSVGGSSIGSVTNQGLATESSSVTNPSKMNQNKNNSTSGKSLMDSIGSGGDGLFGTSSMNQNMNQYTNRIGSYKNDSGLGLSNDFNMSSYLNNDRV